MPDDHNPYRNTLDHLLEGFQIIAPDWTYLYVNPAAAAHGRTTPDALQGRTMKEAYPGIEQSPLFTTLQRVMIERTPASIENHFTFPDGSARWFELRIEPVPEGVVVHSIDIEDRKKIEAELHRMNDELERRVIDRTRELDAANRELAAFGYTVSHDLRAPLRAIDGFSRMLIEDCGEQLDDVGTKYLERIRAASARMERLIEDLLMLSRLGRSSVKRAEVDITALAESVAVGLDQAEPSRQVEWRIAPGMRARCDQGLTRIVFENLLGNAWKFTARADHAVIEVRESEDTPGAFVVIDNGAGFDMQHSGTLFQPFQRLHQSTDFPGTGIGLATVQLIVEKHGGKVRATGEVNRGARVTVSFEA